MAKMKPADWMVEIDNALRYRKKYGREEKWHELELTYMNDPHGMAAIGPNLIYSMGDTLLSNLTVMDPEIVVEPLLFGGVQGAPIIESLSDVLIQQLNIKHWVEMSTLHEYLFPCAILKIGYDSEYGFNPYYDIGQNNFFGATATQFDKKGNRIEYADVKPGWPWVRSVLPHDFVVPWGTHSIEEAPWCAMRFIRLNEHIKKDPKYKNKQRLEPQISMEQYMASYDKVQADRIRYASNSNAFIANKKPAFNELWEIRDRTTGRVYVVARDHDKFLRDDQDIIQLALGELPYVVESFIKHPRTMWTTPLSYYLGQTQATTTDIAIQEEKQRRINNLKFLVQDGAMTVEEAERLLSGDVGAIGFIKSTKPVKDVVATFPQGQEFQFTAQKEQQRGDARDAIGFGRNQIGEYDASSRRTAREATFVAQGSRTRTNNRAGSTERLYTGAISKCMRLIAKFWEQPRQINVQGNWRTITGHDIDSQYVYKLSLMNKEILSKSQRLIESITMAARMAQMGVPMQGNNLMNHIMNAASDPRFSALLNNPNTNRQQALPQQGQNQGQLPTIPATGA